MDTAAATAAFQKIAAQNFSYDLAVPLCRLRRNGPQEMRAAVRSQLESLAERADNYAVEIAANLALHALDDLDWEAVARHVHALHDDAAEGIKTTFAALPFSERLEARTPERLQAACTEADPRLDDGTFGANQSLGQGDFDWAALHAAWQAEGLIPAPPGP